MCDGCDNGIFRAAGLRGNHVAVSAFIVSEHVRSGSSLCGNALI